MLVLTSLIVYNSDKGNKNDNNNINNNDNNNINSTNKTVNHNTNNNDNHNTNKNVNHNTNNNDNHNGNINTNDNDNNNIINNDNINNNNNNTNNVNNNDNVIITHTFIHIYFIYRHTKYTFNQSIQYIQKDKRTDSQNSERKYVRTFIHNYIIMVFINNVFKNNKQQ